MGSCAFLPVQQSLSLYGLGRTASLISTLRQPLQIEENLFCAVDFIVFFLTHGIASSLHLLLHLFFFQGLILNVDQKPLLFLDNFKPLASG